MNTKARVGMRSVKSVSQCLSVFKKAHCFISCNGISQNIFRAIKILRRFSAQAVKSGLKRGRRTHQKHRIVPYRTRGKALGNRCRSPAVHTAQQRAEIRQQHLITYAGFKIDLSLSPDNIGNWCRKRRISCVSTHMKYFSEKKLISLRQNSVSTALVAHIHDPCGTGRLFCADAAFNCIHASLVCR